MKTLTTRIAALGLSLLVAACSGGGNSGTCLFSCPPPGGGVAASLDVARSGSEIKGNGSDSITITVTALDKDRNVVANAPVTFVADSNVVITPSGTATDATGKVTAVITTGSDHSNRTVTVKATSNSLASSTTFAVTGTVLTNTLLTVVPPNSAQDVRYHLVDATGQPIGNVAINVDGVGATVQGTTDLNGDFTYSYTAPASGFVTLVASAGGVSLTTVVTLNSTVTAPAGPVSIAAISINPTTVNVNTQGSITNTAEIRTNFLNDLNEPVQNVRVTFGFDGNVTAIDGSIAAGSSSLLLSGTDGIVRSQFIAGTRASVVNGITVHACWDLNDFDVATCPHKITAVVKVVDQPINVAVGTDGLIHTDANVQFYYLQYAVQVTDVTGQPKSGVSIVVERDLPYYYKGFYLSDGIVWNQIRANPPCPNEDVDRNGFINVDAVTGNSEDANGTTTLEPPLSDISVSPLTAGSNVTDASGHAYFQMSYFRNKASWESFALKFSGVVSGSEGSAYVSGVTPVPATVLKAIDADPPFKVSTFGVLTGAPLSQVTVGSPPKTQFLCTSPN